MSSNNNNKIVVYLENITITIESTDPSILLPELYSYRKRNSCMFALKFNDFRSFSARNINLYQTKLICRIKANSPSNNPLHYVCEYKVGREWFIQHGLCLIGNRLEQDSSISKVWDKHMISNDLFGMEGIILEDTMSYRSCHSKISKMAPPEMTKVVSEDGTEEHIFPLVFLFSCIARKKSFSSSPCLTINNDNNSGNSGGNIISKHSNLLYMGISDHYSPSI